MDFSYRDHISNALPTSPRLTQYSVARKSVGLKNFGNTCYCNAPLQLLFSANKLCRWFLTNQINGLPPINFNSQYRGQLLQEWLSLLKEVYSDEQTIEPISSHTRLLQLVRYQNPQLEEDQQCDAHEFLRYFLDGLNVECNVVSPPKAIQKIKPTSNDSINLAGERFWANHMDKERSIITELFGGLTVSKILCLNCKRVRFSFDFFLDLSVDISEDECSKSVELIDLIEASFMDRTENILLDCPHCLTRSKTEIQYSIWRLPSEYLVIHIKRFRWDSSKGLMKRVNAKVRLPQSEVINLKSCCRLSEHISTKNSNFNFLGFVSHFGTANSGHYTSEVLVDKRWLYFSDETTQNDYSPDCDSKGVYIILLQRQSSQFNPTLMNYEQIRSKSNFSNASRYSYLDFKESRTSNNKYNHENIKISKDYANYFQVTDPVVGVRVDREKFSLEEHLSYLKISDTNTDKEPSKSKASLSTIKSTSNFPNSYSISTGNNKNSSHKSELLDNLAKKHTIRIHKQI